MRSGRGQRNNRDKGILKKLRGTDDLLGDGYMDIQFLSLTLTYILYFVSTYKQFTL